MEKECPACGHCYDPELAPELKGGCPRCVAAFVADDTEQMDTAEALQHAMGGMEPLTPGTVFCGMEIVERLGKGGMGYVYRARQPKLDRVVALKILDPRLAASSQFADRFNREAKALAALSHPNIVPVYDFGQEGDTHYLVMEFIDGANLRQVLMTKRMDPSTALRYVPQICDALEYAHGEGIVHRDIKPENILIDKRGNLKIADFGLAKMTMEKQSASPITLTGQVMGTPSYMAPEQLRGMTGVDHRADIYSLGVVIYEMLTGELPIGRFPVPSETVNVDVQLDRVVLKALETDPERRYQHASQIKAEMTGTSTNSSRGECTSTPASAKSPVPKLALLGALATPIALLAGVLCFGDFHSVRFRPIGLQAPAEIRALVMAAGIGGLGLILSLVHLLKARRSQQSVRGTGLAWFGLCAPLLLSVIYTGVVTLSPLSSEEMNRLRIRKRMRENDRYQALIQSEGMGPALRDIEALWEDLRSIVIDPAKPLSSREHQYSINHYFAAKSDARNRMSAIHPHIDKLHMILDPAIVPEAMVALHREPQPIKEKLFEDDDGNELKAEDLKTFLRKAKLVDTRTLSDKSARGMARVSDGKITFTLPVLHCQPEVNVFSNDKILIDRGWRLGYCTLVKAAMREIFMLDSPKEPTPTVD